MLCPIDLASCIDDLCYGGGCIRCEGEDMIEVCDVCRKPIYPDLGGCDCDEEFDYTDDDLD